MLKIKKNLTVENERRRGENRVSFFEFDESLKNI